MIRLDILLLLIFPPALNDVFCCICGTPKPPPALKLFPNDPELLAGKPPPVLNKPPPVLKLRPVPGFVVPKADDVPKLKVFVLFWLFCPNKPVPGVPKPPVLVPKNYIKND